MSSVISWVVTVGTLPTLLAGLEPRRTVTLDPGRGSSRRREEL